MIKNNILITKVGLFFAVIGLLFVTNPLMAKPQKIEGIIAIVDGKAILLSEFEESWQLFIKSLGNKINAPTAELKNRVLENLILLELQQKSAENNGIRVNQRELNSQIETIAQNNKLTLKQLFQLIIQRGQTIEQFREDIRQQIIVQRLQQQLFAPRIQISEKEIEEYLNNQNITNDPYEYQYLQLLISPKENQSASWKKTEQQANNIIEKFKAGLNFDQAIKIYSNNTLSKQNFDDNQWNEASSLPDQFHTALTKLKKNEISKPIKTGRGYFILKLIDKRYKKITEAYRYQLQQILLSNASYTKQSATQLYQKIRSAINNDNIEQNFALYAKEYSQDQYNHKDGKTGWLTSYQLSPNILNAINHTSDNRIRFIATAEGWLIYRILKQEKYNATEELQKQTIKQKLYYEKIQTEYEQYLRNLRLTAAVRINTSFE